jgi:hypothetical protein
MLIEVARSKRRGYAVFVIPMKDEGNSEYFAEHLDGCGSWVYFKDNKWHGKIPPMVLPELIHQFGGEAKIKNAGYRKHWNVFQDLRTGEFTFGNKASLSMGDEYERNLASKMLVVDPEELSKL